MAKYIDLLKIVITNKQNTLFLLIIFFYIVLLIIDWVTNKKFPYIGSFLLLIIGTFSLAYVLFRNKIPSSITNFLIKNFGSVRKTIYSSLIYSLIVSTVVYIWKINRLKNKNAFITKGYSDLPLDLMFIVNSNGKVVYQTPFAQEAFNSSGNILKTIKKNVDTILIDDQIIKKNSLFEILNSEKDLEGFNLKFTQDSDEKEFQLVKKNFYIRKKYRGYIIYLDNFSVVETKVDFAINKENLLNSFDEPLAYYKPDVKSYLLNKAMVKFLKTEDYIISEDDFKAFVYPNDLSFFIQKPDDLTLVKKNIFRLLVDDKTYWFEGSYTQDEVIIRRTSIINQRNKLIFKTHQDLAGDIKQLLVNNKEFGLLTISFVNILDVAMKDGKDLSNALIAHYFRSLLDGPYKNEIELYQLGNIEFGLLVNNLTNFDIITREIIENKTTSFKEVSYVINKENIKVDIAVGIISSRNIDDLNSEEIISASYEALQEAADPKYPNNYSIYYPKTKVKEYSFEDFDIDLSEGFLEKYKID